MKAESFSNGQYHIATDDSETVQDPSIHAEAMNTYFRNQLISTIMLPEYIDSCTVVNSNETVRFQFTGNNAFAEFLCQNAGQQLYADAELLTDKATPIETANLTCYLEIDGITSLPLGSGIHYAGSYKAEGLPYSFTYDACQAYQYALN